MRSALLLFWVTILVIPETTSARQVPSPAEFLGHELGTRFTRHDQVLAYYDLVASRSDRVILQRYGSTYEGRDLVMAFVSSPKNLSRLEEIRVDHLRQAGIEEGAATGDPTGIVWLSYNVHGNESVSTEASMATLYDLVRTDAADRGAWLDETVVILDPCINPDGRERYVQWYNRTVGVFPDADPAATEHHEPAPGGRGNHYLFDLNRDWSWFSQQETRARMAEYNRWLPHVHVDFHEQGVDSPYYFAPAVEPYHEVITDWQREFQELIGSNNAQIFDRNAWLFFTRESFDLLYPGYGDTYPTYNGAIGMTYEQGGSGRAGLGIRTAEGDTLRLTDRIAHHHATGLSTIEVAVANRERLVSEFASYFSESASKPGGAYGAFVMHASSGVDRLDAMEAHLDRLGIRYGTVSTKRSARGLNYRSGVTEPVTVEPGDLVVSAYQPKGRFARVLFEPDVTLADSATYDITAWALPYAYGMEAHAVQGRIDPDQERARTGGIMGPVRPAPPIPVPAPGVERALAYVAEWSSPADAKFLAEALRSGLTARVATEPFSAAGGSWKAGTLVFTRTGNEDPRLGFDTVLERLAAKHGRNLTALPSGRVTTGRDFGSSSVRFVEAPRVLLAFGDGSGSGSAGEAWHWFDERIGYPATRVPVDALASLDLGDWDVLVLPSGSYGSVFDDEGLVRLREWVSGGGRVIALDSAVRTFSGKEGFSLKPMPRDDDDKEEGEAAEPERRRYADRNRSRISEEVSGAVYAVDVDATHPLGFGLERGHFVLRKSATTWPYLEGSRAWNVGVIAGGTQVSGFVGSEVGDRMDHTLVFGVEDIGQGAVVYIPDGPLFRAFWYEGDLLFANAVFMPLR